MKLETPPLTRDNMNQNLLDIQYAVRGPILQRAVEIERELEKGIQKPFERVVRANIGDCHALGQRPFTFIRQVVSLATCPELASSAAVPADVKQRVRDVLADCTQGSVGAYSPSAGLRSVREAAAQYLQARDGGVPADEDHIFLGSGASDIIKSVLSLFVHTHDDGRKASVMIPIPQYPLFSGTLAELGLAQAPYYLAEERNWALDVEELERSWAEASSTTHVRAIVVINPGNPTGQVLTRENMEEIVRFAQRRRLVVLADEVYQENIVEKPFFSFKKVMCEMGPPYSWLPLASFMTASKGWAAECGLRAGLAEVLRLPRDVFRALVTMRAVAQCPNVLGQLALHCILRPPQPGSASHAVFAAERRAVQRLLAERCRGAWRGFNAIPGYTCNPIDGSMFAFPRVSLSAGARREAAARGLRPDDFYCLQLLEETGVCVVPGSGFGQAPGTFHFRTTILHPADEFHYMMDAFTSFHRKFLQKYS